MIPRPPTWRPGGPAPWAGLPAAQRTGIGVDRVLGAWAPLGQRGPVPEDIGADRVLGPAVSSMSRRPAVRRVNAGVLAVLFEEDGEARLILTRRSSALRTHKGEVSFPGGRLDEGEDAGGRRVPRGLRGGRPRSLAGHVVGLDPSGDDDGLRFADHAGAGHGGGRPHLVATRSRWNGSSTSRCGAGRPGDLSRGALAHSRARASRAPDNSFAVWFFEISGEMIWGATARMIHELLSIVVMGRSGLTGPSVPAGSRGSGPKRTDR